MPPDSGTGTGAGSGGGAGTGGGQAAGWPLRLANEFGEVVVSKVTTRNGVRLRIAAPKAGREILLCPLELESLTWQTTDTFSGFLATPYGPEPEAE